MDVYGTMYGTTETLRGPGWGGRGWRRLVAAPGRGTVMWLLWGLDCECGSSGCSSAGPCGFARVCPLCNCIMIVIILDIT